jgi:hypothetical protein
MGKASAKRTGEKRAAKAALPEDVFFGIDGCVLYLEPADFFAGRAVPASWLEDSWGGAQCESCGEEPFKNAWRKSAAVDAAHMTITCKCGRDYRVQTYSGPGAASRYES